ncbi:transcriptional regulator [Balneolaceae bacterium YR4-1]|uniref:Transcriptional regulator n=1 Tax=Halalkalibaculum roseum TaxID=2709311 RepID=A0A6M1ST65_9BACT|nr:transcriptional regulator [Halalkalibaculum roseum]NGP76080.1 transcriptional regulator [Halalkalibaculum roseum]
MPQKRYKELSPGEVLERNYLVPNNWTPDELASILMMPVQEVNLLLDGKLSVTEMRACHLAAGLNTSKEFWLRLEQMRKRKGSKS